MNGHGFREDESGVSPVIGIVLMVAITVLLAATVAAFVFGFDDRAENVDSPTAALGFDYDAGGSDHDELVIHHQSGDPVDTDHLYVAIDDATCASGTDDPNGRYGVDGDFTSPPAELKAGNTLTIDDGMSSPLCSGSGRLDLSGATVYVVWESDGGQSTELQSWQK